MDNVLHDPSHRATQMLLHVLGHDRCQVMSLGPTGCRVASPGDSGHPAAMIGGQEEDSGDGGGGGGGGGDFRSSSRRDLRN